MIWYCYKGGSHIVSRDIQGLLIRGIPESMIFEAEAETQLEAKQKAALIIKNANLDCHNFKIKTDGKIFRT